MRSRFVRFGAVAVGVLGLLAPSAAPASATVRARTAAVVGTLVLGAKLLGFPCTGSKSAPLTGKCNITPSIHDDLPLPLPTGGSEDLTNFHFHWNANTNVPIINVADIVCADLGVSLLKAPKVPAHAGLCSFDDVAGHPKNHVNGYCGLSGGQVVLIFVDALGQAWTLDIHFTRFAPVLPIYLTGHATKASTGRTYKLLGLADATPIPVFLPTPLSTPLHLFNNSCLNKTATEFTISGTLGWAGLN